VSTLQQRTFQGFILFRNYRRTWSFPREIERIVMDETGIGSVLHLYGGLARFGTRLDMDPATSPDVVGNALYPPFKCKSFDYVVVDPPYQDLRSHMALPIIIPAACIARKRVFWLHTHWAIRSGFGLSLSRWWLGSPCSMGSPIRMLAEYKVTGHPKFCNGRPRKGRKRFNHLMQKYDWSRFVPNPKRQEDPVWQIKLPLGD